LLWDLFVWAHATGARWFDLGGIPDSRVASSHQFRGITEFKLHLSRDEVIVGEEWHLEPRPLLAQLARTLNRASNMLGAIQLGLRTAKT
jgi:lipid II:glycine glycyltransferase (peptidoglycan interpeptide bridge formation enzyme)